MRLHQTYDDLQALLPEAAIEEVGDRRELVIYTGWSRGKDDVLVAMAEPDDASPITDDERDTITSWIVGIDRHTFVPTPATLMSLAEVLRKVIA